MNDADEWIDRVLEGLRTQEAGPQLERRIARHLGERLEHKELLEQRARLGPRPGSLPWLATLMGVRGNVVAACTGTAIALAFLFATVVHYKAAGRAMRAEVSTPASGPLRQQQVRELKLPQPPVHGAVFDRPRRAIAPHHAPLGVERGAKADTAAVELAHAPSMLAPPMPLTAQERLLVQIAQRGQPETYALLNPTVRARNEAEDRTSFLAFFEPPPPPGEGKTGEGKSGEAKREAK